MTQANPKRLSRFEVVQQREPMNHLDEIGDPGEIIRSQVNVDLVLDKIENLCLSDNQRKHDIAAFLLFAR